MKDLDIGATSIVGIAFTKSHFLPAFHSLQQPFAMRTFGVTPLRPNRVAPKVACVPEALPDEVRSCRRLVNVNAPVLGLLQQTLDCCFIWQFL